MAEPTERGRTIQLFSQACAGGALAACRRGSELLAATPAPTTTPVVALVLHTAACDGDDASACRRAGLLYRDGGDGLAADPERAAQLLERACDGGVLDACVAVAALLTGEAPAERLRRARALGALCLAGRVPSCEAAVAILAQLPTDQADAPAVASRGCELGGTASCVFAGDLARLGRGVARDRTVAHVSYARACTEETRTGCAGLRTLCGEGHLLSCERSLRPGQGAPSSGDRSRLLTEVAELRRVGDDEAAVSRLEAAVADGTAPEVEAELGLAYQGAGRFVDAERVLQDALRATDDTWVARHQAGLGLALELSAERLAWLTVDCAAPLAEASIVGGPPEIFACGTPQRVVAGAVHVEVRAPDRRSHRELIQIAAGEQERWSTELTSLECESIDMMHTGGAGGGCCWPGQSWGETGACEGAASCPPNTAADGDDCVPLDDAPTGVRLASFHLGVFGGVTGFISADTSLFRSGVDSSASSTGIGGRLELRVGARVYGPLGVGVILGGTRQGVDHWLECSAGTGDCVDTAPTASGVDVGVMLRLHTNPIRRLGAAELHLGVGVRPFARLYFDSDQAGQATGELTATVIPAELGFTLYLGAGFSLDVVGQGELWLPREYCGAGPDGSQSCLGASSLSHEFAWSALAGVTFHVGR